LVRASLAEWPHIQISAAHQHNRRDGWTAQQFIKLETAAQSKSEWVAIIGPGNMLIGPAPFFDSEGRPWIEYDFKLTTSSPGAFSRKWKSTCNSRKGIATPQAPSILTPWVWHVPSLRLALDQAPPFSKWKNFDTLEQYHYWIWAHDRVSYQQTQLIQGIKCATIDPEPSLKNWRQGCSAPWWLLHRTAYYADIKYLEVTLEVMEQSGAITSEQLSQYYVDYLNKKWH
jgi:hypothetical protein